MVYPFVAKFSSVCCLSIVVVLAAVVITWLLIPWLLIPWLLFLKFLLLELTQSILKAIHALVPATVVLFCPFRHNSDWGWVEVVQPFASDLAGRNKFGFLQKMEMLHHT